MPAITMETFSSPELSRAVLLTSLVSAWTLVGLFYHFNQSAPKRHLVIWTRAWVFYALWLTLSLRFGSIVPTRAIVAIQQVCISISTIMLIWGSLRCLNLRVPKRLFSGLIFFLAFWIGFSPDLFKNIWEVHLPVFLLLGLGTPFGALCLLRARAGKMFFGGAMASLGFLWWVNYLGSYPFPAEYDEIHRVGFAMTALLQLLLVASVLILQFRSSRQNQPSPALTGLTENLLPGSVAYNLNNALSPITAYSELLLETARGLADEQKEQLQRINKAAAAIAQIVAQMRGQGTTGAVLLSNIHAGALVPQHHPAGTFKACRPLRILCIDDEPELRQVLRDVLTADHHEVSLARGGREGLDLFRAHIQSGQPYEAVITDLAMPDLDGNALAIAIKAESPETPVIMLTGWGVESGAGKAPAVDAILGKPARRQELSSLLWQVTARSAA